MLGTTNTSQSQASMNTLSISINGTNKVTYNGKDSKSLDISLSSLGAAASNHTHSYLPLTGGTLSGILYANGGVRIINPTPYIDFHFASSAFYTSNIYEFEPGKLLYNNNFCTVRGQGSYNVGWFHIHNGEEVMYYKNDTLFNRRLIWEALDGTKLFCDDIGHVGSKWNGYRLQRYADSPQIDEYICVEDQFTHLGSLARFNNYALPNYGPMYLGEQNKYINGDPGGWIHLSYNTYITGPLDVYGVVRTRGSNFYQDDNIGGIVAMQSNGPNTKMLWAW